MEERVRFSPSSTGDLHLGGARTALFNWLTARRSGGSFIVRFEDADADRSAPRFEAAILEDLAWLGLEWDEGPDVGGSAGPYRQSERAALYEDALARLRSLGAVYPCFCEAAEAASDQGPGIASGQAPRCRGRCRELPAPDAATRLAAGERAVWRFAVDPASGRVAFEDVVHGRVAVDAAEIGDFVAAGGDGKATYDLACAVDDGAMGVTTVIRGDDHLADTPRQVLLHRALEQAVPVFAHLPMVLGEDGAPLSRSRGAEPVSRLRAQGYLPVAVINHLALLGWSDPMGREVLTRDNLLTVFDLGRISPAPATHDAARLRWLDGRHLRLLDTDSLAALILPYVPPLPGWLDAGALAEALRDGLETASDAGPLASPVVAPLPLDEEALAALGAPGASEALAAARRVVAGLSGSLGEEAPDAMKSALAEEGIPDREGLPAVRAALTGRAHGLPVGALFGLLGRDETLARLGAARQVDSASGGVDS